MTGVKDREAYQRLNFLYQAAHCVLAQTPENEELARFYCYTQRTISKRLVLRQDPSVKRTLCKRCSSLLLPGVTATVRLRKRSQRMTVVRCLSCGLTKRFPNKPGYSLWAERPEAQLQSEAHSTGQCQRQTGHCSQGSDLREPGEERSEAPADKE
ncbi:ribonuclease P protein subunit p21 [Heterodontus francisci]|uniref:ribonuclease P protein subunit p21 n=1 Tax=Heterodontus francisci TaxID=7792 RepID=UPI00355C8D41